MASPHGTRTADRESDHARAHAGGAGSALRSGAVRLSSGPSAIPGDNSAIELEWSEAGTPTDDLFDMRTAAAPGRIVAPRDGGSSR
jgi:hypothetical protein